MPKSYQKWNLKFVYCDQTKPTVVFTGSLHKVLILAWHEIKCNKNLTGVYISKFQEESD